VHFISRNCRVASVVAMWVGTAALMSLLMLVDQQTGVLGGYFGGEIRGAGTFENPNMCGSYVVMSFFLAWSAAAGGRRHYYLALPVLIAGMLATASNGALASLVVGVVAASTMQSRRRPLQWVGAALMLAAIAIVGLAATHERLASSSMDLMTRGRESVGGTAVDGAMERFPLWLDAAHSVQRVPTGVGPGNFNREGGAVSGVFHGAHNEYLGMLAERGPIGLIGWCAVLFSTVGALLRMHRRQSAAFLGIGIEPLVGAIAAVALHAGVMEFFHFRHLWMLLVVIHAAVAETGIESSRAAVAVPRPVVAEGA
jgi:O-antigen ligase